MGELGEIYRGMKEDRKERRAKYGVNCPRCNVVQPRRIPSILLPGQQCRVCKYSDPRKWEDIEEIEKNQEVVTATNEPRQYRMCECCVCKTVEQCTPSFDFYTTDDHGDKLLCEDCFHKYVSHKLKEK